MEELGGCSEACPEQAVARVRCRLGLSAGVPPMEFFCPRGNGLNEAVRVVR